MIRGSTLLLFAGVLGGAMGIGAPGDAAAQVPADSVPPADTVPPDTLPPDTLPGPPAPDTVPADSLAAPTVADTVAVEEIVLERLPDPEPAIPGGWETGIWEWGREELLGTRAATLAELLEEVPGLTPLRGGDFGMPRSVAAFGSGGGGVRVFRDGVEFLPLEGSVPDLSRLGLGRTESVRVVRTSEGVEIHLRSLTPDDPRPYSRIEAATGDLDTNFLEGVFFHPRALGGNVAFSLQRVDTRGPRGIEPGAVTNVGLRYAWLRGSRLGVVAEISRSNVDRDTLFLPPRVGRTDLSLQGRWAPLEGLVGELFWTRASMEADSVAGVAPGFPFADEPRSQWGARLAGDRGPLAARLAYRGFGGAGLPEREIESEISALHPDLGGVAAWWSWSDWAPRDTRTKRFRGWSAPFRGFSVFGSWSDFERGVPWLPEVEPPPASVGRRGFYEGRGLRLGGRFVWRDVELSGAWLDLRRDSVHPLALPVDRQGPVVAAGERRGLEGALRLPVPVLDGLALVGSGQIWDQSVDPWPYLPRRTWRGALSFHDTFFPTGNLEVWADLGVEGRDAMWVSLPGADPAEGAPPAFVPEYRSWYSRLQIRVVTVRIFIRWENMTLRDTNQDFPGRILPRTRSLYGIRWTLWN